MQKIHRPNIGLDTNKVGNDLLPGAEELKSAHRQMLNADLAPMATREVLSLVGVARANEQLRLNVPPEVKQDFFTLRRLVSRSRTQTSGQDLIDALEQTPEGLTEEAVSFMRASLAREHNMLALVEDVLKDVGHIYNRVVSSQEG